MKERAVKAGVSLPPTPDGIRAPLADEHGQAGYRGASSSSEAGARRNPRDKHGTSETFLVREARMVRESEKNGVQPAELT